MPVPMWLPDSGTMGFPGQDDDEIRRRMMASQLMNPLAISAPSNMRSAASVPALANASGLRITNAGQAYTPGGAIPPGLFQAPEGKSPLAVMLPGKPTIEGGNGLLDRQGVAGALAGLAERGRWQNLTERAGATSGDEAEDKTRFEQIAKEHGARPVYGIPTWDDEPMTEAELRRAVVESLGRAIRRGQDVRPGLQILQGLESVKSAQERQQLEQAQADWYRTHAKTSEEMVDVQRQRADAFEAAQKFHEDALKWKQEQGTKISGMKPWQDQIREAQRFWARRYETIKKNSTRVDLMFDDEARARNEADGRAAEANMRALLLAEERLTSGDTQGVMAILNQIGGSSPVAGELGPGPSLSETAAEHLRGLTGPGPRTSAAPAASQPAPATPGMPTQGQGGAPPRPGSFEGQKANNHSTGQTWQWRGGRWALIQ